MYSNKSGMAAINPETTGVVVCTIEKANILVNRLLEEEKMGILSCLIIDELHMVRARQHANLSCINRTDCYILEFRLEEVVRITVIQP